MSISPSVQTFIESKSFYIQVRYFKITTDQDARFVQILKWCTNNIGVIGRNTCKICEQYTASIPSKVALLEGDQQHKIHAIESLVHKEWGLYSSNHQEQHANEAQFFFKKHIYLLMTELNRNVEFVTRNHL